MKNTLKALAFSTCISLATSASALVIGLNPASPLGGFNLGGGEYATLVGVQSGSSLVGESITSADLFGAINSGTVLGFYYGAGNAASAQFDNISLFAPFVSANVIAGAGNTGRIWDSLYAVHTGTVVFKNGSGGTTTMTTGGTRIDRDPFSPSSVPDGGASIGLFGIALAGIALLRRKILG